MNRSLFRLPSIKTGYYTAIMKAGPAILLRCFLALALVAGGIPAWSMGGAPASADMAAEAIPDAMADSGSDCHEGGGESAPISSSETTHGDCCGEQDDNCTHDKCDCACPALTLVVPIRSAPTTLVGVQGPSNALTAPATQKVITTLLRPPRA